MQKGTIDIILAAAGNDPTATPELIRAITAATNPNRKPRLINRRQAAEILGCSRKTVSRYVQKGLIKAIKFTERTTRFDENEIISFARQGVDA